MAVDGKRAAFRKPDFCELEVYAAKIGLPAVEINKFFNHYEANGWRVNGGHKKMEQWQASMRNWKINWEEGRYRGNGHSNAAPGPVRSIAEKELGI